MCFLKPQIVFQVWLKEPQAGMRQLFGEDKFKQISSSTALRVQQAKGARLVRLDLPEFKSNDFTITRWLYIHCLYFQIVLYFRVNLSTVSYISIYKILYLHYFYFWVNSDIRKWYFTPFLKYGYKYRFSYVDKVSSLGLSYYSLASVKFPVIGRSILRFFLSHLFYK